MRETERGQRQTNKERYKTWRERERERDLRLSSILSLSWCCTYLWLLNESGPHLKLNLVKLYKLKLTMRERERERWGTWGVKSVRGMR